MSLIILCPIRRYIDKEHGKINLRVKEVGDFVQIELEDNGKGIGQKDCRIFLTGFIGQMHSKFL